MFQPSKDHSRGLQLINFISKLIRLHLFDIVILGHEYEQDTAKVLHSISAFIGSVAASVVYG